MSSKPDGRQLKRRIDDLDEEIDDYMRILQGRRMYLECVQPESPPVREPTPGPGIEFARMYRRNEYVYRIAYERWAIKERDRLKRIVDALPT